MINDEFLIKIDTIIKYLKENNGYKYKLYNHCCPEYEDMDSNIVEYAEDIKNYWIDIYGYNDYEKFVINEICSIIKDNLELILRYKDKALINLREYCNSKTDNEKLESTPHDVLIILTNEALLELLKCNNLYDFRN